MTQISEKFKNPDISFTEEINDRFEFQINCIKSGDRYSCHIPAYDCIFSAKDEESAKKKGRAFAKMWFEHYQIK